MPRLPSQLTYNDLNGSEAKEILVDWFRQLLDQQSILQPHLTLPMAKITLDIGIAVDMYVGGTVPIASPPDHLDMTGAVTLSNDVGGGASGASGASMRATGRDSVPEHRESRVSTVVNAAPVPGGRPPDQIREQHGLPVPRPGYGDRETGRHLFLGDVEAPVEPYKKDMEPPAASTTGGRQGIVADGYTLSSEPVVPVREQTIDLGRGEIQIDLTGAGIHHAGMVVRDDTHRRSVKEYGDKRGDRYSSVNGVYDAGPAGLATNRGGGGLYTDGRPRISFGNDQKGK
jgi:hypothetical protein